MRHSKPPQAERSSSRWVRPSLSPYVVDEVAFTLSDIRQARTPSPSSDR
jgi:hypothetical protein